MKQDKFSLRTLTGAALLAAAFAAASTGAPPGAGTALAQGGVSPQKPARHFRVERPAGLSGADALTIYNRILDDMVAGYRLSGLDYVDRYRTWRRYNTVPYRSAQHGERYVNNFANDAGDDYRHFEASGEMPAGAILVKDSFAVTKRGDVFSGPLFVMEKMSTGFNLASRDWRYVMVMPDGSLFGETGGVNSQNVDFCIGCHAMRQQYDHLFFLPEEFRLKPIETGQ